MSEWQPIETAPKDGTEIDIWEYCHDPAWRPDEHGIEHGMRLTVVRWGGEYWEQFDQVGMAGAGFYSCCNNGHYTISHWMPIPRPPNAI